MTPRSTPSCTHERRPGTIVCLRCRHEALVATRARRRKAGIRLLARAAGVAAIVAGGGYLLTGGEEGGMPRFDMPRFEMPRLSIPTTSAPVARVAPRSFAVTQSGEVTQPRPVAATPAVATPAPTATPATAPAIPVGRTELRGGVFAERTGDTVIVHFDTPDARTRRSDKFERVVRETLPLVLGDAGRAAMEQLPAGSLLPPGRLIPALEAAPLHIPVGDGRTIRMMPVARDGRDGPLVVTYRAVIQTTTARSAS